MKNTAQIINSLDIATKEYCDGKFSTTTNVPSEYLKSRVNEIWSVYTFMPMESAGMIEGLIWDNGVDFQNVFQTGAVYLTTDPDFNPNDHFFDYGNDRFGNPIINNDWTQLEDVITLKQKNDPTKEVTIYAWQRTSS